MKSLKLILLALLSLCAASCTTSRPIVHHHDDKLHFERDEKWILTSIRQKEVVYLDDQEKVYIQFNPETNNFSGYSGCNHFFGDYQYKPESDCQGQLSLDHVGATMMMCPDEAMKLETTLLPLLSKTTHCTLTAYTLTLMQGSKVLLVFEKL